MTQRVPLWSVVWYFLRLGLTGFGGPVALASYMRRDLVERYEWIAPEEYDEGLAIATACPGPLAYQLGVYCGYVMHGPLGALAVAVAFATAPFWIVVGIAALYVRFGSTWQLRALFNGVGPVVIAIIVRSCWDLGRKTLRADWRAWAFAAVACAITVTVQRELVAVFLISGAIGVVLFAQTGAPSSSVPSGPKRTIATSIVPVVASLYQWVPLPKLFWFFFKTGLLVFGSGLVVVPFLKAYVVDQYHWLSNRAFLDAVAVGIVSPGPVVITATFVGYLNHALAGAAVATAGIFSPSLAFVLLGTPILRRYRTNGRVQGFIRGVTVAVVGVLVGTSYLVGRSAVRDAFTLTLFAIALAALCLPKKIPEPLLVAAGALCGYLTAALVQ